MDSSAVQQRRGEMNDATSATRRNATSFDDPTWLAARRLAPPPGRGERAYRGVAGMTLARPWFDRAVLASLRHLVFPASRLWAAAVESDGDPERFFAAVAIPGRFDRRDHLIHRLAQVQAATATADAIDRAWLEAFFGEREVSPSRRMALETARRAARHDLFAKRWPLRRLGGRNPPRAQLEIATPDAVAAIYGGGRAAFAQHLSAPTIMPEVEVSRPLPTHLGSDFWLRFPSPSPRLGDTVWARVHEPAGFKDPPTVIFGHGICVEFDHWKGLIDETTALVERGFRVVRPESPWHGRRSLPGRYGGEPTIARFPIGALDAISGAVREWAVLAHWVRARSSAPLVFAGSSLGAMTAQLAADSSADWPAALRPDALLLITHTGDMASAILDGALTTLWAPPESAIARGWTPELARSYLSLLDPVRPQPLPASRIVSVLGRRDVILPFAGGRALVERWSVPESNLFIWDRGHFSVPMTLIRNTAPLDRLTEIVQSFSA